MEVKILKYELQISELKHASNWVGVFSCPQAWDYPRYFSVERVNDDPFPEKWLMDRLKVLAKKEIKRKKNEKRPQETKQDGCIRNDEQRQKDANEAH